MLFLNVELLVADSNSDLRKLIRRGVGRKRVATLLVVQLGTWNLIVDGLAELVADHHESGTSVSDGGVAGQVDGLAVDGSRGRVEHPKALAVVHGSVADLLARGFDGCFINGSECEKGLALVGIILVLNRA